MSFSFSQSSVDFFFFFILFFLFFFKHLLLVICSVYLNFSFFLLLNNDVLLFFFNTHQLIFLPHVCSLQFIFVPSFFLSFNLNVPFLMCVRACVCMCVYLHLSFSSSFSCFLLFYLSFLLNFFLSFSAILFLFFSLTIFFSSVTDFLDVVFRTFVHHIMATSGLNTSHIVLIWLVHMAQNLHYVIYLLTLQSSIL